MNFDYLPFSVELFFDHKSLILSDVSLLIIEPEINYAYDCIIIDYAYICIYGKMIISHLRVIQQIKLCIKYGQSN